MYVYVNLHIFTTRIKVQVHTKNNCYNFDSLCRLSREILPTQKYWSVKNQVWIPLSELTYIHIHTYLFKCIKIPKYHRWWVARLREAVHDLLCRINSLKRDRAYIYYSVPIRAREDPRGICIGLIRADHRR